MAPNGQPPSYVTRAEFVEHEEMDQAEHGRIGEFLFGGPNHPNPLTLRLQRIEDGLAERKWIMRAVLLTLIGLLVSTLFRPAAALLASPSPASAPSK